RLPPAPPRARRGGRAPSDRDGGRRPAGRGEGAGRALVGPVPRGRAGREGRRVARAGAPRGPDGDRGAGLRRGPPPPPGALGAVSPVARGPPRDGRGLPGAGARGRRADAAPPRGPARPAPRE